MNVCHWPLTAGSGHCGKACFPLFDSHSHGMVHVPSSQSAECNKNQFISPTASRCAANTSVAFVAPFWLHVWNAVINYRNTENEKNVGRFFKYKLITRNKETLTTSLNNRRRIINNGLHSKLIRGHFILQSFMPSKFTNNENGSYSNYKPKPFNIKSISIWKTLGLTKISDGTKCCGPVVLVNKK